MNITITSDDVKFLSKEAIENIKSIEDVKNLLLHLQLNSYVNVRLKAFSIKNDLKGNFCVKLHVIFFDIKESFDVKESTPQNYIFVNIVNDKNIADYICKLCSELIHGMRIDVAPHH